MKRAYPKDPTGGPSGNSSEQTNFQATSQRPAHQSASAGFADFQCPEKHYRCGETEPDDDSAERHRLRQEYPGAAVPVRSGSQSGEDDCHNATPPGGSDNGGPGARVAHRRCRGLFRPVRGCHVGEYADQVYDRRKALPGSHVGSAAEEVQCGHYGRSAREDNRDGCAVRDSEEGSANAENDAAGTAEDYRYVCDDGC